MPGENKPANQEPVVPQGIFTVEGTLYRYGSVIEDNPAFVAYEVFPVSDLQEIPYLYKLYKHNGERLSQYKSLETKIQAEQEELAELFDVKVERVKITPKNQIGILMPRYYRNLIAVKGENYKLDTHYVGQGGYGRVFKLEPLDPEKEPLAMKVYFDSNCHKGSSKHAHFVRDRQAEVENLAEYFDTQLDSFRNRTVLLMPFFPGKPILTDFHLSVLKLGDPQWQELPLSLRIIITALLVQNALVESMPRIDRSHKRIHGDLKPQNTLVEIVKGDDGATYLQVELIDRGGRNTFSPMIIAPEAVEWVDNGGQCGFRSVDDKKWAIKTEIYALSSVLATFLTASTKNSGHVFSKKFHAQARNTPQTPFCFNLMTQVLRASVEDEIRKFEAAQNASLNKRQVIELTQAMESVSKLVTAMGDQDPEKRPSDVFQILRVLIDAANLCLELEQAQEKRCVQKVNEDKGKEEEKKPRKCAVIPNRHHFLSQKPEKQQRPEISKKTAKKIAGNRISIREKTKAFSTCYQQIIQQPAKLISDQFKALLNRLKKINSPTSKAIVNLINTIKPFHTLEEVLSIIDKIESVAKSSIKQAKTRWFSFFYTGNMNVYQGILDGDLRLLRDQITAIKESIAHNAEYQANLSRFKGEIKTLEEENQQLLKGEAIPSPLALH